MTQARQLRLRSRRRASSRRRLHVEPLETRRLLAGVPFGAQPQDTAEFLLGTVAVNVVFLESNGQIDTSTENWTPQHIADTKARIREGIEWWKQALAKRTSVHSLDFTFDFTYADNPVPTKYEPIARMSDDYVLWVNEFLDHVGYNSPKSIDEDIRLFNHALRSAHGTNWGFTIFVVNSQNDADGQFAPNGSFNQAFAFAGGRYIVSPSRRPAMTFAHEMGHIFWARDEYQGVGNYTDKRGYYDTQNWNAANNPTPGFVQEDSIMAAGTRMFNAYENFISAASTLEQVGWRDTDGDGVFDVLDVPHKLSGIGYFDPVIAKYRFRGTAQVGTLLNENSSGLQSDITTNKITRAEYRIDGGPWQTAAQYNTYTATLDLQISVPAGDREISIRTVTIDPRTQALVTTSPVFTGRTNAAAFAGTTAIAGRIWNDVDGDGEWDGRETGLPSRTVQLVDAQGQPLPLQTTVEPDQFTDISRLNTATPGVVLSAFGFNALDDSVRSRVAGAATGTRVFAYDNINGIGSPLNFFRESAELRAAFTTPQAYVSLDAIGVGESFGRLEAYDAAGKRIDRFTTKVLADGQVGTMVISRPAADIASIRAFGQGSSVRLDRLRFGIPSTIVSGAGGGYVYEYLPNGEYRVVVQPSAGAQVTAPLGGAHQVTVNGTAASQHHFGLKPERPWQNQVNQFDVSGDGLLTPSDLILLVADLSQNQSRALPAPTDQLGPHPYWDVTGDGLANPQDVIRLLTHLSQSKGQGGSGEPGGRGPTGGGSGFSGGSGPSGEGEQPARGRPAAEIAEDRPSGGPFLSRLFFSTHRAARRREELLDRVFADWAGEQAQNGANWKSQFPPHEAAVGVRERATAARRPAPADEKNASAPAAPPRPAPVVPPLPPDMRIAPNAAPHPDDVSHDDHDHQHHEETEESETP